MSGTKKIFATIGAIGHAEESREELDFYATPPRAVELLLEQEEFWGIVLEPACGAGHISGVLAENGYKVISCDIVDRGYSGTVIQDFLSKDAIKPANGCCWDIITNPPYRHAQEFVEKALNKICSGYKVAMFLKLTFLEGRRRKKLFEKYPPHTIYVCSSRITCAKNGDFEKYKNGGAMAYAWFVWVKGYKGLTTVKWIG